MKKCAICAGSQNDQVNGALLAGQSTRTVAVVFGYSKSAIHRHQVCCMPKAGAAPTTPTGEHQSSLHSLYARCSALLTKAEGKDDHRTAAQLLSQLDDLQRRMALVSAPGKGRPDLENFRLRITFDDPSDPTARGSADVWQNLDFAAKH